MPKAAPDLNIDVEEYKGFTVPASTFPYQLTLCTTLRLFVSQVLSLPQ